MGNKLRDEDLHLNIIVNGDKGQKELGDLEKSTRELTNRNKELRMEKEKLIRAGKQETEQYNALEAEIKENNKAIKTNETRMVELRKQLGLTALTMRQLQSEQTRLKRLINSTTPNTTQWKMYKAELAKVEAQIAKVTVASRTMQLSMRKVADGVNRYYNMAVTGIAVATGVVFSLAQWTKGLIGLDDALADVQKTTGLTRKEAREMYTDFRFMNTRTPRKELLLLAEEAGRLGKTSRKDIEDFVEVANKIKVALGDDLGGEADVALREVGKLTEIFKVGEQYGTDFKTSMEKIGSGINTVANNSNASAGYLIEYMKRLGGVSVQARIGAADIMGYAATLDQLGQNVEMAATAQSKIIVDMFTDPAKYARIAKMEVGEFSKLLKTDANQAFIKFLEGLNGNNEGLSVMATKLDGLGIDGARAVQVLAALSSNTKMVKEQQELANKAMQDGTSLTNEYNIKNNNLAGSMAKIGQFIHSKFVNSGLIGFMESAISKLAKMTEVTHPLTKALQEEAISVNALVIQLTSANTSADVRKEIYKKLNEIAPDVVKNIDAENISLSTLRTNLEQYNQAMIKKIALQDSEETLADKREAAGKATAKRLELEEKLATVLGTFQNTYKDTEYAKKIKEIAESNLDIVEKYRQTYKLFKSETDGRERLVVSARETEKKATDDVTKSLEVYLDRYNKVMGITSSLKSPNNNNNNTGGIGGTGSAGGGEGGGYSPGLTDKEKKQNESLYDKARKALIPDSDEPLKVSEYAGEAIRAAEELAKKKASEEEWTAFLKDQINQRTVAELEALERDQEIAEVRNEIKNIQVAAIGELASTLAGMFEQGSAAQIAMIAVEKAMAIAQIWINLAREKSAISLAARRMDLALPGSGIAWEAIMTTKAITAAKFNTGLVLAQTVASAVSSKKREKKQAYSAGKYPGLQTGMYGDQPHYALFNEVPGQPEMVVDGLTTRKIRLNYPEIMQAILAVRDGNYGKYASGKYPGTGTLQPGTRNEEPGTDSSLLLAKLDQMITRIEEIQPVVSIKTIQDELDRYVKIKQNSGL